MIFSILIGVIVLQKTHKQKPQYPFKRQNHTNKEKKKIKEKTVHCKSGNNNKLMAKSFVFIERQDYTVLTNKGKMSIVFRLNEYIY